MGLLLVLVSTSRAAGLELGAVVCVGVGAYEDPSVEDLRFSPADARTMAALPWALPRHSGDRVYLVADGARHRPTRQGIEDVVREALSVLGEDQALLFYFSGHGVQVDGEPVLLPSDVEWTNLPSGGLRLKELFSLGRTSGAGRHVIVMDACRQPVAAAKALDLRDPALSSEGDVIFSATATGLKAWEYGERGLGAFTYFLSAALKGEADADGDGAVALGEAHAQVQSRLARWSSEQGQTQRPTLAVEADTDVILCRPGSASRSRRRAVPNAALAPRTDVKAPRAASEAGRARERVLAIVAGVSEYADPTVGSLRFASGDAVALVETLKQDAKATGRQLDVHLLADSQGEPPSLARVRQVLASSTSREQSYDLVLFFFSGHGLSVGGEPRLLFSDFDPAELERSTLAVTEVWSTLQSTTSALPLMIMDACHSGLEAVLSGSAGAGSAEAWTPSIAEGRPWIMLSSSGIHEASWELGHLGRGLFTHCLLKGAAGAADRNGDGGITLTELSAYCGEQVRTLSAGRQNPRLIGRLVEDRVLFGSRSREPPAPSAAPAVVDIELRVGEAVFEGELFYFAVDDARERLFVRRVSGGNKKINLSGRIGDELAKTKAVPSWFDMQSESFSGWKGSGRSLESPDGSLLARLEAGALMLYSARAEVLSSLADVGLFVWTSERELLVFLHGRMERPTGLYRVYVEESSVAR